MEMTKNPGLKTNVVSMYKSYFKTQGFFRPKIVSNLIIPGKVKKEHLVDIYFEFIQMNNLQRTVIKTIEGAEVSEKDVWEFANVLKDLNFFAKGIIYYDNLASIDAKKVAEIANIDLIKFEMNDEVRKSVLEKIKIMLPNKDVIGDPFWVIMEKEKSTIDANNGNYYLHEGNIVLFLSKKQAEKFCYNINDDYDVYGISQNHLKILVAMQEKKMFPAFALALPEFEQEKKNNLICVNMRCEDFRKYYIRGDSGEE